MLNCPALVLMTRWPAINRCKSRLANSIGPYKAALVQERLINHTFKVAKTLEERNLVEVFIAITGISDGSAQKWAKKIGIKNINTQGLGNLGLKMRRQVLKRQHRNKPRTTIIIGTDLPTLSQRDIIEAIESLKNNQIVLGPSKDGGYWLIGLSKKLLRPVAIWPFINIPWGTNMVLKTTLLSAASQNISYSLLKDKNDIDLEEDLFPWNE